MNKLIIKFSLVDESKERTNEEILNEISEVFSKEEINIPWCNKVEEIKITQK